MCLRSWHRTRAGARHRPAGRDRVEALVKDAAAQGARVRTAGRIREADADADGYFVLPTVVTGLAQGSALADKVTDQLIAGTVSVNCHGMAAQDPRVPFGGVGQSGLGRELGADGIRAFTQPRGYVRQPAPQ
jgi:acyl-CoA reductase-like NAD-dependent aldehyde dehydrogenase